MQTSELDLLTTDEAAELLRVDRTKIYDLIRKGELHAYRLSDGPKPRRRIERAELLRFLHRDHERTAA
jgi:excisionase family DNA binding protein